MPRDHCVCLSKLYGFFLSQQLADSASPPYSTVTLLARLRGLSTSVPRAQAV